MTSIASFYNNLLTIQVTVFGVIAAVVFVFIQIVYSNFSHRQVGPLVRNALVIAYFCLSSLTLGITALASLLLSFDTHDFLPAWDLRSRLILSKPSMALLLLVLTLLSVGLFLVLVLRNLRYLQPHRILLMAGNAIAAKELRLFLFKKYGIRSPDFGPRLSIELPEQILKSVLPYIEDRSAEPSAQDKSALEEKLRAEEEKRKANLQTFNDLKSEAEQASDPFEVISDVAIRAINSCDLRTLDEVKNVISEVSDRFVKTLKKSNGHSWDPDATLAENFSDYLISLVKVQIEVAERQELRSAKLKSLEITKDVALHLYHAGHFSSVARVMNFWKLTADRSIGGDKEVFNYLIEQYSEIGHLAFDNQNQDILDETFRHLGWLGERLLPKKGFEEKPLMSDMSYSTEYDYLLNTLLSFSSKYDSELPDQYPLIYFDAIYVVFRQLVALRIRDKKTSELNHSLFSCMYVYSSFASVALAAGNSDGGALAALRLKECYDDLVKNGLQDSAKEAVQLLVEAGAKAAMHKEKLKRVDFLSGAIDEYVMKILQDSPFVTEISAEIRECLIKSTGDHAHNQVWGFIKALGKSMGTNFGFMFDWTTGETYSKDDPRRH